MIFKKNLVKRKRVACLSVKIHRKRKGILIQRVYFRHPCEKKEIAEGFFRAGIKRIFLRINLVAKQDLKYILCF